MAGPHSNILGCFRLPIDYIIADLKWDKKTVIHILNELAQKSFLIYDNEIEWVFLEFFLEWHPIDDSNKAKIIEKLYLHVPEKTILQAPLINALLYYHPFHLNKEFREHMQAILPQLK